MVQNSSIFSAVAMEIQQSYASYVYIDGLLHKRCNSIANALELCLFCIEP